MCDAGVTALPAFGIQLSPHQLLFSANAHQDHEVFVSATSLGLLPNFQGKKS